MSFRAFAMLIATAATFLNSTARAEDCHRGPFSGFTIGLDASRAVAERAAAYTPPTFHFPNSQGFEAREEMSDTFLGGRVGFAFQCGSIVYGIETDISMMDFHTVTNATDPFGTTNFWANELTVSSAVETWGTLRGRLGYEVAPSLLFYGTAGLAFGRVEHDLAWIYYGLPDNVTRASSETTKFGWAAGGGAEYAFDRWSIRTEALFVDLGTTTMSFRIPGVFGASATQQTGRWEERFVVGRIGLTFKLQK